MSRFSPILGAAAVLAAPLVVARAGGVRIVEPTGTQNFADIQAAVNAAPDGAVLLVGEGTYYGFTVAGKSISIFGLGLTTVDGVTVTGIGGDQAVVISNLRVRGSGWPGGSVTPPALDVQDSTGSVRFQHCRFEDADFFENVSCAPGADGGAGAVLSNCSKIAFSDCDFEGGEGESWDELPGCSWQDAGDGGTGLSITGSTLAIYDCDVNGGEGGRARGNSSTGTGGAGASFASTHVVASGVNFIGGHGGLSYSAPWCRNQGGAGCVIASGSAFDDVGCNFLGGYTGCNGKGPSVSGGPHDVMPGPARVATVAETVQSDAAPWDVSFQGGPSDRVFFFSSLPSHFAISLPFHGTWLVYRPMLLPTVSLGQASPGGALDTLVQPPNLPAGSVYEQRYAQLVTRKAGLVYLGSPAVLLRIDRESGPDCNGNGVSDFVDVIEGTSADANHNLIPDSCSGG